MRQRHQLIPAYVLHARPYRDSSLLIEAFTCDQGRIGLVARAGRSRHGALLQPLQPLLLSWTQQGELGACQGVESAGPRRLLRGEVLFAALYCNELLLKMTTRQDPHPELWIAYERLLERLLPRTVSSALRYFEHDLLCALGYGLDLGQLEAESHYGFDVVEGLRPLRSQVASSVGVSGAVLQALAAGQLGEGQANDLKPLLRAALERHMTSGKLRTPGVWKALRQLQGNITHPAGAAAP